MGKSNSYNQILQQAFFKYKMSTIFLCRAWGVESAFHANFFFFLFVGSFKEAGERKVDFWLTDAIPRFT